MTLLPHQQRVVDERQELEERLTKLRQFLGTEICLGLPFDERSLLVRQERVMTEYSDILADRINLFLRNSDSV